MSIKRLAKSRRLWVNIVLGLGVVVLILTNVKVAGAHNWWSWHWHTGRTMNTWVGSYKGLESNRALNDWDSHSDINFNRTGHSELSVFAGNYGATGWGGLASIESYSYDWWHRWNWSKINHCHARFNSYYGGSSSWVQGVQCQEIGHCLGLTHSNDGCMGLGYYNNVRTTVSHNWRDINARY